MEYQPNTVTYETISASFLATKCLKVIAHYAGKDQPEAARIIIRDKFHMDDILRLVVMT